MNEPDVVDKASRAMLESFYFDDLLSSTDTTDEAATLLSELTGRLASFGIKLHKFVSSHGEALRNIPEDHLDSGMKNLPAEGNEHSALGIKWDTEADTLSITVNLPKREFTKRGILSVVGSL